MTRLVPALFLLSVATASAAGGVPTRSESALMRGVPLPFMHGEQRTGWHTQIDLSNDFVLASNANESLRIDGEAVVVRLGYRQTFADGWETGLSLPLVSQGGGFMDGIISDWHDWFGLPNAGRERRPEDEFVYQYSRNGVTLMDVQGGADGPGDALAWIGQQVGGVVGKLAVQLPIGDEDELLGSGEPGAALWLELPWQSGAWSGHLSGGGSWARAGGQLASIRREFLPIASAAIDWRASPGLSFLAQLNAHGRAFDGSRLDALNRHGVQLVLGGHFVIGQTEFGLIFQEDIVTASSPDFALHLSWHGID